MAPRSELLAARPRGGAYCCDVLREMEAALRQIRTLTGPFVAQEERPVPRWTHATTARGRDVRHATEDGTTTLCGVLVYARTMERWTPDNPKGCETCRRIASGRYGPEAEPDDVTAKLEAAVRVPARGAVTPEAVIVAAARAFVAAWTGDGAACLLPEHVEAHAFALVAATELLTEGGRDGQPGAVRESETPRRSVAPGSVVPDDAASEDRPVVAREAVGLRVPEDTPEARAPDLSGLWNDAESIYEAEFPRPRHYFGMLPSLAKIAYFERAALEAIERAAGLAHTVRARVVSVEEMKRYLHAAVPTEITGG